MNSVRPFVALLAVVVGLEGTALADPPPTSDVPLPPVVRPLPPTVEPQTETDDGGETVLGRRLTHGGYGAPSLKMTSLSNNSAMLVGGEGGWIIGHRLVLGAAGYGTAVSVPSPALLQSPTNDARLSLAYGGFRIGAVIAERRLTHVTLGVLFGGGGADSVTGDGTFRRRDGFFVIEPDVEAEVNLARHVRIAAGGSYRFIGGTDVPGFTPTRLGGPAALLLLRFGEF